jgi:hypothetical protein
MSELIEVEDLTNEFVICRTIGHSWDENPNAEVDTMFPTEFLFALRCVRCTTERFDFSNVTGQLIQRYYRYPEKYHTVKTTREVFRAEMLSRSLLVHFYKKRRARKSK